MGKNGAQLLDDHAWDAIVRELRLSRREQQILTSIIEDQLTTEDDIAHALGMSPHTVHTHLERLYRKTGVASRSHLILRVFAEYVRLAPSTRLAV